MPLPRSGNLRASPINIATVRADLWTTGVDQTTYTGENAAYQAAVLDQYKIYVEMADRISARRASTNVFFLSLNTATLTVAGALWRSAPLTSWLLVPPLVLLLIQNAAWFWLVRSYRQLNTAKYIVIGMLEEQLPASPYWRAEWKALGEGKKRALYWPLTHLEQGVPIAIAGLYILSFIIAVAMS